MTTLGFKNLQKDFSNLDEVLKPYLSMLEEAEEHLKIEGKTLEKANVEQAAWHSYYDERKVELKSLSDYVNARVNSIRGTLFQNFTETYSFDLPERTKDKYVDKEPAYLDIYEVYLEVHELYKKFDSIVEAFKSRGFALRNITQIRVAALEDVLL